MSIKNETMRGGSYMWPKWHIFKADIDNLGGLKAAATQTRISLTTLTA
jgi:hypothetical protein